MPQTNTAALDDLMKKMGLAEFISFDSTFGKAVLSAAESAVGTMPRGADLETIAAFALQPGRLMGLAAAVQKATDSQQSKTMIADALAGGSSTAA